MRGGGVGGGRGVCVCSSLCICQVTRRKTRVVTLPGSENQFSLQDQHPPPHISPLPPPPPPRHPSPPKPQLPLSRPLLSKAPTQPPLQSPPRWRSGKALEWQTRGSVDTVPDGSHTSDFKWVPPVAARPGAGRCKGNARTGRTGVLILSLGDIARSICDLSVWGCR